MDEQKKWTPEMDVVLVDMRDDGYLYREIAERLGVTARRARARAEKLRSPPTPRIKWTPEFDAQIEGMIATHTCREIANAMGLPYPAVASRARLFIDPKPRRRRRLGKIEPSSELELAPGHVAVDARSYDLIRDAGKDGEEECLTTL